MWNGNTLIPLYDLDGTVCGLKYNGVAYYFYKNLQGDVIAITDDTGETVARYTYDAWGKVLTVKDASGNNITSTAHIANINPFRYRSYYYDTEIGLYYLQSRYYDAQVGRFINCDDLQAILSEGLDSIGYNIFAYCHNTPTNGSDINGQAFVQIFAKIILGIIFGVYSQLVFDILDYLVDLISNSNAKFSASAWDYVLSIFSCILAFFDIRNPIVRILVNALPIALSYVGRTMNKTMWANLITDIMFLIVGEIIGRALSRSKTKKIEKAVKKINKNKKKLSKILRDGKIKKKTVNIEQRFYALGVGVTFSLNISNKIINSVASIFVK